MGATKTQEDFCNSPLEMRSGMGSQNYPESIAMRGEHHWPVATIDDKCPRIVDIKKLRSSPTTGNAEDLIRYEGSSLSSLAVKNVRERSRTDRTHVTTSEIELGVGPPIAKWNFGDQNECKKNLW